MPHRKKKTTRKRPTTTTQKTNTQSHMRRNVELGACVAQAKSACRKWQNVANADASAKKRRVQCTLFVRKHVIISRTSRINARTDNKFHATFESILMRVCCLCTPLRPSQFVQFALAAARLYAALKRPILLAGWPFSNLPHSYTMGDG